MSFTVVAISTGAPKENYYTFNEFFASLLRHDCEPLIIKPDPSKRFGLMDKAKLLHKAIIGNAITSDLIIFADCFDLVFADSPYKIIERYKEFNAPFVCSSEKNCFPADFKDQFPEAPTSYKYLNSGFIVAETEAMLTVLESMDLENVPDDYYDPEKGCSIHFNDQRYYQEAFVKQPVKMVLDYKQELSQTLCEVSLDELDFSGERIRNKETDSQPLTFHFNGPSKTNGTREPILKHLGL